MSRKRRGALRRGSPALSTSSASTTSSSSSRCSSSASSHLEDNGGYRREQLFRISSIVALSILPFVPSLDGEFVFDDRKTVVENGIVTGAKPLGEIFTSDYWGDPIVSPRSHKSYRPLTTFTFWLNHLLHGLWTPGYHAVNLFLHALSSLLVCALAATVLRKSGRDRDHGENYRIPMGAWIAAMIFAVHPVHTEAIANISGRAELLMACFYSASLLVYLHEVVQEVFGSLRWPLFSLLVTFATASKEQGITAPVVALLIGLLLHRDDSQRGSTRILGVLSLSGLLLLARLSLNDWRSPPFSALDNPGAAVENPILRILNLAQYWMHSFRLLIFPSQLCCDYSMGTFPVIESWTDLRALSSAVLLLIMASISSSLLLLSSPSRRLLLVSSVLGIVPFVPASSLFVTAGFTVAERVLYVPSIGLCLLVGVVYAKVEKSFPHPSRAIGWALMCLAVAASFQRSLEWRSGLELYSADTKSCSTNAKLHYNLGKVLADVGRRSEAEERYRQSLRLHPSYESALNNLGNLLESTGRFEEAEEMLRRAVRVSPTFPAAWMNLGITLMKKGMTKDSERALLLSLSLRPNSAEARFNLGVLYLQEKRMAEAKDAWINATGLDASHTRSWSNLFVLLDEMDECEEIFSLSSHCLLHASSLHSVRLSLGACYGRRERFPEAEHHLLEALKIVPESPTAHANLGVLYDRWSRFADARISYLSALNLDPSLESIQRNLEVVDRKLNITRV